MAKEVIRVKIDKQGGMQFEVAGAKGKSCTELTEGLEVYLGKVTEREFTADYYKPAGPEKKNFVTNS